MKSLQVFPGHRAGRVEEAQLIPSGRLGGWEGGQGRDAREDHPEKMALEPRYEECFCL